MPRGPDKTPPPLLDPERKRDRRRVLRLFVPYRLRLGSVIGLIVFSAGLSMISPFLLRSVLGRSDGGHRRVRH